MFYLYLSKKMYVHQLSVFYLTQSHASVIYLSFVTWQYAAEQAQSFPLAIVIVIVKIISWSSSSFSSAWRV